MNPTDTEPAYPSRERAAEDAALIARMAVGDEGALAALYDRWSAGAYSLIMQILRDADEAEDVLEEAFWQAWRSAPSYSPERAAVSTWLLTIARSRALDRLRSRRRAREVSIEAESVIGDVQASSSPEDDASSSERARLVAGALRELPVEQRRVLELGYFHGLSQSEIAEHTGQPLGTVKTRMRLAMQKMRERLVALHEDGG